MKIDMSNQTPKIYRHHCLYCGGVLTSPKSIKRGYGPSCWEKVRPQPIKPYIEETPFVEIGDRYYRVRTYCELGDLF